MADAPSTPTAASIADVVKRLIDLSKRQRDLNRESKGLREDINNLKALVIAHMQNASIDVCKVTHGGKSGELALRKAKRTRALKKCDAVSEMSKWLQREINIDIDKSGEMADKLWDDVQSSRESTEVLDLSVRKLV